MPPQVTRARDVMHEGPSLQAGEKGSSLVKKLSGKYHSLPVINEDSEVIGVVSERNILRALRNHESLFESTARTLMSCGHAEHEYCRTPVVVTADTPIHYVLRTLFRERLSAVPVVQERKLVGIIDRHDIIIA